MLSPRSTNSGAANIARDSTMYNRHKYYSALRTGFKHLGNEDKAILELPEHIVDPTLLIFVNPFKSMAQNQ